MQALAEDWLSDTPKAEVRSVSWHGHAMVVEVRCPGGLPDIADLQHSVDDALPTDPGVTVVHTVGERISE